jgi:ribosomal protein L21E
VGEHVVAAIRERGEEIAQNVVETLEVGTRVRIIGRLKPQYFTGKRGRVLSIDGTMVQVKLDKPIKRYRKTYVQVGIPANHVEILDLA